MQYIPNHIILASLLIAIFAAAVLFLVALIYRAKLKKKAKLEGQEFVWSWAPANTLGNLAIGSLTAFLILFSSIGAYFVREHAIRSEIRDAYGIELSTKDVSSLEYPWFTPRSDFEVFGSFIGKIQTEGSSFTTKTLYLVWVGDHFELSQSDEEGSYTPLELKR